MYFITWIFDEGSFVPSAKITKDDTFSIVSDYLGTPCLMYNGVGNLVWQAELDIYGKVRTLGKGNINDCPFRYQGQYHDTEVDLYYNRFRYYSPESGMYINQDPIGLIGGDKLYSYVHNTNAFIDVLGLAHGLGAELIRGNKTIFKEDYESGGNKGGGRLNQQEALLTHTERKFLDDIDGKVQGGDHLKMTGELNPCRPGCQPAIRDFVAQNGVTAEYHASSTGKTYSWQKISDDIVRQTEFDGTDSVSYDYNVVKRTRVKCNK